MFGGVGCPAHRLMSLKLFAVFVVTDDAGSPSGKVSKKYFYWLSKRWVKVLWDDYSFEQMQMNGMNFVILQEFEVNPNLEFS